MPFLSAGLSFAGRLFIFEAVRITRRRLAAAFIMAEYLEIPYIQVALAVSLPAFLFYFALMLSVYINAIKNGIPALPKDRIPNLLETLGKYGHLMPPSASYVILASLIVPSLLEIGLAPLPAHMFVFIFCCIGPITPPVALAAYATAEKIAASDPNKTGFVAFKMGMSGYIIPFLFVYNSALLFIGTTLDIISNTIIISIVGLSILVFALEGYFIKKLNGVVRALQLVAVPLLFMISSNF